ncbi:polyprenyl synthetase family protein [Algisphaera agarilytica]|uniref:Octaprenyl-diphosphate synthase n=1 Tax=Algisphaera agarilytica TaxID=1385975 RepID=A0A7X0H859_9BACT|nr:polyprenyl synthetase family protein [Algisphaera agarilytica]MBB6431021.1 octaprenyl-diphosphate synthase [Algisphaera agarilytica]
MLLLSPNDGEIHATLTQRLAQVESRFRAELLSDLPNVNTLAEHVERYRGKMLRPTLVLVSAMAAYPERDEDEQFQDWVTTVATVAEMVHMATLVHDDILDEAEMRRRGATINHLRGNEAAVMLGDYLISHAYHLCSAIPLPAASRAIAAATNTVCEGELLQLHHREDWELGERTYFEIIRRKTASLCGVCCQMPVVLETGQVDSGAAVGQTLFEFGQKLGVAFQIIDDVLDLTGNPEEVGKTLGRDLAKGKLTLPLIHHLASVGASEREALVADLKRGVDDDAVARLREAIREGEGLDYARQWAERLVGDAKSSIEMQLPPSDARQLLVGMADAVISRRF